MINERQFNHLSEMGIHLYQRRELASDELNSNAQELDNFLAIDAEKTLNTQFFNDVLTSLSLSQGEVNVKEKHIDLGLFNWRFTEDEDKALSFEGATLTSPAIDKLCQSSALKSQLWQLINAHLL